MPHVVNLALLGWPAPLLEWCMVLLGFSKDFILCCVCTYVFVYAAGDSVDEFRLLFWNELVQCDLEPEPGVGILTEHRR